VIRGIDHFVLTVRSLETTCKFYERVLSFKRVDAAGRPTLLTFGHHRINIHEVQHTLDPKAAVPAPGADDFCLVIERPLAEVRSPIEACGVVIEVGPIKRIGGQGAMTSPYFRDPDGNLVEVSEYDRRPLD